MDVLLEILAEVVDFLLPDYTGESMEKQLGCALVFIYIVMMCTAIGMGIWVLGVNVPAGIALIVVGALLFIGSLIGFIKILFGRKKK